MAGWFRRDGDDRGRDPSPAEPEPDDSPDALRARQWELVRFVNSHAGRLPVEAVVLARDVTDSISQLIDVARERALDVYAVVSINSIVGDYLPTTLRAYLALDPQLTDRAGPSGRTPRTALREQLESLAGAAADLSRATQAHDVDAIFTQGNFLRTKFSGSDLDL